jgi:hypothetical protein
MEQTKRSMFFLKKNSNKIWNYMLVEPFFWLLYCFFQPIRFKNEFKVQYFWQRIVPMLRLILPIFLLSYPLAFAIQAIFLNSFSFRGLSMQPDVILFFRTTAWVTVISVGLGTAAGIIGGIVGDISLGIILGTALSISGVAGNSNLGIIVGITVAIAIGSIAGTVKGVSFGMWSGTFGVLAGIVGGIVWAGSWLLTNGSKGAVGGGVEVAIAFFVSYIIGYYRFLLYPVSGLSGLMTFFTSRKDPLQVFFHLHHSSLYWDERIFLPLPRLKDTLLLAAGQDTKLALEEIAFIITERPQQIGAAQAASLEIALHDLELCESIRDIARASQPLAEILPQEAALLNPRWVTTFARLNDVSKDAARYIGPLGWKARHDALEDMIVNLEKVYPKSSFSDPGLNKRLNDVVNTWRLTCKYELEKLEQAPEKTGQIDNPYNPGQVLKPRDSLFVGRRDLVQQLAEALGKGSRRPTFLLNGERRMGKSSTLKQLPHLLGAHYLPIVYDLQARGVSASTDGFLNTIGSEIYKVINARGMRVKKLDPVGLREASRKNEAEVYRLFDEWLDALEKMLEREDRTLLLLFDEFEKLEEAGHDGFLNLNLLLDWFRSTIQNRPHVALLFSGVRTFGEMGANWSGYFINAQTLKVTFLHPSEAFDLITQPIHNFPSQDIFGDGVVEQIMRVTGCHPFLIQAVCSALIEKLNLDNREWAELEDVAVAVDQVLENWWDTYFRDLWERSDQNQQTCLVALRDGNESDLQQIAWQSGLNEKTVRRTIQTLLKRDLVLQEKSGYHITAPIYSQWVQRNS